MVFVEVKTRRTHDAGHPAAGTHVQHLLSGGQLAPEFKRHGVDEIVCISVNDAFVMNEWRNEQQAFNLTFLPAVATPDYPGYVQAILDGGVRIVETAGRNPAQVMPALKEAGVKVIGFDITFSKSTPEDAAFAHAMRAHGNVVFGMVFNDAGDQSPPSMACSCRRAMSTSPR